MSATIVDGNKIADDIIQEVVNAKDPNYKLEVLVPNP